MIRREIQIINQLGLHARPASRLVKIAALSRADLWIEKDGQRVNGKSIMGVMMLAAEKGSTIILEAKGEGEKELLDQIEELIRNKFEEE
jgi:phosphocarrier protein HPr